MTTIETSANSNTIYLLTGAAGFLGSNITRTLISKGKKVRALVLPGDPAASQVPAEAEVTLGNLLDNKSLEEFFTVPKGTDIIVIHCASMVTVSAELTQKLYDINVGGTRNILDKCLEYKVKKLVYVSSTSAIPELPHGQVICEIDRFNPKDVTSGYGQTKAEASQLVLDTVKETGLDASIVFPSGICGPNDYAYGYYSKAIMDIAFERMPAGIAGSFNAVDARDLAEGIIACAEKGRKGEGYILSNDIVTIDDIFELVSKYTGAKRVTTIMPLPVAKAVATVSEAYGKVTNTQVALTSFAVYNLARNNTFSSEKAVRELGYKTRPFDETIRDTIAWLLSEGKITESYNLEKGRIQEILENIKKITMEIHESEKSKFETHKMQFMERHKEAVSQRPDIIDKVKQADGIGNKTKAVIENISIAAKATTQKEKERRAEMRNNAKVKPKSDS